ncbi:MAG: TIGR02680 family protein [Thermoanaerobacteraceae bacterium]|nr:TIGR02680 family protein [Thermoanaerobacteraceae bacterium]
MIERWMINRIGLLNFWYYDDEIFEFADGRLLLRGANGSGKSVTMQSVIPLLLDANKSPERLDPFGSRARKLEDYLLGEEDINGFDERTGYLFMEFKREKKDNYITIGMGLKAKRHQSMDFWGFVILDGRRIGINFFLYKMETGDDGKRVKVPFTKKELKNRIGDGGEVVESQKEYMEMVNKHIFGFDSIDEYDELIKLLVQLRSPKLSKDFRPTVIYEIMKASLPSLTDDDLRPLSETIENMDQIKMHLDELYRNMAAVKKLKNEYDNYNRYILYEKSSDLIKAYNDLYASKKEYDELNRNMETYRITIQQLGDAIISLENERDAMKKKEEQLSNGDAKRTQQELIEEENRLKTYIADKEKKDGELRNKQDKYYDLEKKLKSIQDDKYIRDKQIKDKFDEISSIAQDIDFMEHEFSYSELKKVYGNEFDFGYWKSELKKHREKIKHALNALKEEAEANKKYDASLVEQERLKKAKESKAKNVEEAERQFVEEKSRYVEKVYDWSENNIELKLSKEELEGLSRVILAYGDNTVFDDIISYVRKPYQEISNGIQQEILRLENQKELKQGVLEEKIKLLDEWKNKKDPEPERDIQVVNNRKRLKTAGIPHIPLYMAVDFKDDVDEITRGNIESAMEDMGLLDALIIPGKYFEKALEMDSNMADKYIMPGTFNMMLNVSQYFNVVDNEEGVSAEDISDALSNVFICEENGTTYVDQNGTYGIGVIKGKARDGIRHKYIGFESRKCYREELIKSIEEEIRIIKAEISSIDDEISSRKLRIQKLDYEYSIFPVKDDIEEAYKYLKTANADYEYACNKLDEQLLIVKSCFEELQKNKAIVRELTSCINIHADIETYTSAYEDIEEYNAGLQEIEISYSKYVLLISNEEMLMQQKQDIEYDIDNLKYEISVLGSKIQNSAKKIEMLKEVLKELGLEEIERELEICLRRLDEIPDEITGKSAEKAKLEERLERNAKDLLSLQEEINLKQDIYNIAEEGLKRELSLGFVKNDVEIDNILKLSKNIVSEYRMAFDKAGFDREKFTGKLQNVYYECRNELLEYGLSIGYIFDVVSTSDDEKIKEAENKQRRLQITANISGKIVSLYTLYSNIEDDIRANEGLLRDTDRHLFEEIIMHNVGIKIRAKIFKAEEWVKKMNRLMSERDTSSGLKFFLEWKSVAADNEQELDTKELVDILKSDADMLKQEVFDKVVNHFRSKVDRARRVLEEKDNTETFHKIMKDILDYRDWFEFRLYYRKEGENRKELTDSAFNKLSGGEKAMAMYIPLFSAVYSRYEGASPSAPRVISLDEAFAGVDDTNIRDMFKLIEDLRFNFIINSQVLWGDYDTVPKLSICELVRPKNADFVTVIRYLWDGRVKHLMLEADEEAAIMQVGAANG